MGAYAQIGNGQAGGAARECDRCAKVLTIHQKLNGTAGCSCAWRTGDDGGGECHRVTEPGGIGRSHQIRHGGGRQNGQVARDVVEPVTGRGLSGTEDSAGIESHGRGGIGLGVNQVQGATQHAGRVGAEESRVGHAQAWVRCAVDASHVVGGDGEQGQGEAKVFAGERGGIGQVQVIRRAGQREDRRRGYQGAHRVSSVVRTRRSRGEAVVSSGVGGGTGLRVLDDQRPGLDGAGIAAEVITSFQLPGAVGVFTDQAGQGHQGMERAGERRGPVSDGGGRGVVQNRVAEPQRAGAAHIAEQGDAHA